MTACHAGRCCCGVQDAERFHAAYSRGVLERAMETIRAVGDKFQVVGQRFALLQQFP
jgi:hypothetical protein